MVKMSVDFPNEAARCQRFLSAEHKVVSMLEANPDLPPRGNQLQDVMALVQPTPIAVRVTNRSDFRCHWPTHASHLEHPNGTSRPSLTSPSTYQGRRATPHRRFLHFALQLDHLAISCKIREIRAAPSHTFGNFGLWLSLVERLVRDQEAVGSNPTSPILNNCGCTAVATATGRGFKSHQPDINHRTLKDVLLLRVTQ
jgi:hypothetical protein